MSSLRHALALMVSVVHAAHRTAVCSLGFLPVQRHPCNALCMRSNVLPGMSTAMFEALSGTYNPSQLAAILATYKRHAAVALHMPVHNSVYKRPVVTEMCDICLVQVRRTPP